MKNGWWWWSLWTAARDDLTMQERSCQVIRKNDGCCYLTWSVWKRVDIVWALVCSRFCASVLSDIRRPERGRFI